MPRSSTLLKLCCLGGVVLQACCWVRADAHCGNRLGDETCEELGSGRYCDVCIASSHGCTDRLPEAECRFEAPLETSTVADPSTGVGGTPGLEAGPVSDETDQELPDGSGSSAGVVTSTGGSGDMGMTDGATTGDEPPMYPPCATAEDCELPYTICYDYFQNGETSFCTHECGSCEQPGDGEATAECIQPLVLDAPRQCVLDCQGEKTCPEGMICYSVTFLGYQFWRCGW
jgi:hypothetical protein